MSKGLNATIPPEQAADYAKLIDTVQLLVNDAKKKSPLFSIISMNDQEKGRCGALLHLVSNSSIAPC